MRYFIILLFSINGCYAQQLKIDSTNQVYTYYKAYKGNSLESISLGTVGKGSLINGKLIPFNGKNFQYFDTNSYLSGPAYVNNKVLKTILHSYRALDSVDIHRKFYIMECSPKNGGNLFPHKTHQNGLSVDFIMPLIKNNKPYYGLDTIGTTYYFITFNQNGRYNKDTTVSIDFNLVAQQILTLEKSANIYGLRIAKVIINTFFKEELFATTFGKELKNSGIYIVKNLDNYTNNFHDDHFHIDFEAIKK